jgi:hypothetical protein
MPLREGGSLPAIVEADDGFSYVIKFRGAGQGVKALVAEFIGTEIARLANLKVPELVIAMLDEGFGRTEPDEEIQDLLKASTGMNIGVHYLSGSLTFDPDTFYVDPLTASRIVWLDAFLMNVDRTARNTNMLIWQKELWLIDFGACLYFHHAWNNWKDYIVNPFNQIKDHVLLPFAGLLNEADNDMRKVITNELIEEICDAIPNELLKYPDLTLSPDEIRMVYKTFLTERLIHSDLFMNNAKKLYASFV